ncbi:protein BatD [Pedobacter sp. BS3]|uniref:BatD family protein n=1 Tax=Pedobacter sp. BS3 TaxID=2567937 RepID=UPI0011F08B77|nr:BatD family protein [Pedobacter sp. BS3]TZF81850.1 protein BatD [Pedobacter sp. BS3]
MKSFLKYSLFVFLIAFAVLAKPAFAQQITAEASLDTSSIVMGDQTTLHLRVHLPAKAQVAFPALADTITGKIHIVSSSKPDTLNNKNSGAKTITQNYVITAFDAGAHTIPALEIQSPRGAVKTNPLTLYVQSVTVDTSKAIYDIKQPLAVSYTWIDWLKDHWLWIVLPLFVLGVIAAAIYYFRKKPVKQTAPVKAEPALPAHVVALNKLRELGEKKLWQQGLIKQYYSELSDVLREYLERRYTIPAQEQTTDEILRSLKHRDISGSDSDRLRQVLTLADLVKFAKEQPLPAENELSMEMSVGFVESTKMREAAIPQKGGEADGVA